MEKFVLNLRKIHRAFTIPMVILIILKTISTNSAYESTVTMFTSISMMFMVITGLFMYINSKKKKQIISQ